MHLKQLSVKFPISILFCIGTVYTALAEPQLNVIERALDQAVVPITIDQKIENVLPSLELNRVADENITKLRERLSKSGGLADVKALSKDLSPNGQYWLLYHANGRYTIFNIDKRFISAVPQLRGELYSLIVWHWKTSNTLVGTTEKNSLELLESNRYSDDLAPQQTFLFLYAIDRDKLYVLKLPKIDKRNVIYLNGITNKGGLSLYETKPEDYFAGNPERVLGVFDLAPESQAELDKDSP